MILPEDTKVPLSDDEDYLDFDHEVDIEAGYPFPVNPETVSFLPHSHNQHPNPRFPYPPSYSPTSSREKPESLRTRLTKGLGLSGVVSLRVRLAVLAFTLFVCYSLSAAFSMAIRSVTGHEHHHRPGGARVDFWKDDGRFLDCAQLTSMTSQSVAVDGTNSLRSANTTFAIPLTAHEIFASLRAPSVRRVYVTSYDPSELLTAPVDSSLISLEGEDHAAPKVMVTVEAIFEGRGSSSWQTLSDSHVCLMERNSSRHAWGGRRRERGVDERSLGVGIYTSGYQAAQRKRDSAVPLEFRVHIAVPLENASQPLDLRAWYKKRSLEVAAKRTWRESVADAIAAKRASIVDTIMRVLSLHNKRPSNVVPPVHIHTGMGEVHVGNLTGVALASLVVDATVADISVDHVRAEVVQLKTVGNIKADVAVSRFFDVSSLA
jgi:hypothetical protein